MSKVGDLSISYNRGKDSTIFNKSKEILLNSDPLKSDILFLHFSDLDSIGHTYGFDPLLKEYRNTLNKLDYYIECLFSITENKRSNGEDWIFFIVSDHGGYLRLLPNKPYGTIVAMEFPTSRET